jgi:hypothetical protein
VALPADLVVDLEDLVAQEDPVDLVDRLHFLLHPLPHMQFSPTRPPLAVSLRVFSQLHLTMPLMRPQSYSCLLTFTDRLASKRYCRSSVSKCHKSVRALYAQSATAA